MTLLLSVRNLTTRLTINKKDYNVVNKLNLDLFSGQTLAIVGESGCGKSMTALSLLRILPKAAEIHPDSKVLFKGCNLLTLTENEMRKIRGNRISMIFQDPSAALNPLYTIGYQLREVITTHTPHVYSEQQIQKKIEQTLEDVQLKESKHLTKLYPHQLSGGMLQRVMIAMALIQGPDLLIADEPTTALDVTIQGQILQLLKRLVCEKKMSLILITHDMNVVAEIADRVIVMYAAEKIEEAHVVDLFDHGAHPYTQKLFRAKPSHRVTLAPFVTIKGMVPAPGQMPSGCRFHPRCDQALSICKRKPPLNFALPRPQHSAKCWLYDPLLEERLEDEESA